MYAFRIDISRKGYNLSRFLPVHRVLPSSHELFKSDGLDLESKYVIDYFRKNEVFETQEEAKLAFNKKMEEVTNQMNSKAQLLLKKIESLKARKYTT